MTIRPIPHPRQSRWLLPAFTFAYAGGVIAYLPLVSLLLPLKIAAVAGSARIGTLAASVIAGALAASLSNIVIGTLSDRSLARGGGRRRWLAGGVTATAVAYAGLAAADSPVLIVTAVVAFQLSVNALLAPLLAIMADEVATARQGLAGGLIALGAPAAFGVAALLISATGLGPTLRFAAIPMISGACVMPLLVVRGGRGVATNPASPTRRLANRDMRLAWTARLLMQTAGNVLATYLLYYFQSIMPLGTADELATPLARLLLIASLVALPIALFAGQLSDRTGRRREILFAAAGVAAFGLAAMAAADSWAVGAAGFTLYTIGSAVFLALHAGFTMRLLPDPRMRGRDLGMLNLTNTLPALIGPLLTFLLATPRNFAPVMVLLAALVLGGGCLLLGVGEQAQRTRRHQRT